jgi:hypothetical protein
MPAFFCCLIGAAVIGHAANAPSVPHRLVYAGLGALLVLAGVAELWAGRRAK